MAYIADAMVSRSQIPKLDDLSKEMKQIHPWKWLITVEASALPASTPLLPPLPWL